MTRKFHWLRRTIGALLLMVLIGLPFVEINGESAFRFDVPTLRLLFFGTMIGMPDFFIVLIAVIFLTFFAMFATTVFGRIWCGWLCPQTLILDATSFIEKAAKGGYASRTITMAAAALISSVIAFSVIAYFVSPYDLPDLLRHGGIPARIVGGSFIVIAVITFLDLTALRRKFCATVCPYAKMQSVLFDERTLAVAFDPARAEECMHCDACVRACPVNIDVRNGSQMACIHCAECVDACTDRMALRDRKSLVNYVFGLSRDRVPGLRLNPLITGTIAAISFAYLLFLSFSRVPFDMNILLKYPAASPIQRDGRVTNTYEVSVRNIRALDQEFSVSSAASSGSVKVFPEVILLKKDQDVTRVPVVVTLTGLPADLQRVITVTLTLTSNQYNESISKSVYFMTRD